MEVFISVFGVGRTQMGKRFSGRSFRDVVQ